MSDDRLIVSTSPHIGTDESIKKIMFAVIYSLLPASLAAVYFFGPRAIALIAACVISAIGFEYVWQKARNETITAFDGSAIITGLLLALTLPPGLPVYMAVLGTAVSIVIGKQIFGGIGQNIFNPALVGRAFLQASFPIAMGSWTRPLAWLGEATDAATAATPLGLMKFDQQSTVALDLFYGRISGSLGETSALALILGAGYLYYKGYIEWRIPTSILATVFVFGGLLYAVDANLYPDPIFQLLSGSLLLGAFYMATDYVTSPITTMGKIIFGVGIGVIVVTVRIWGGLAEGVMYAILLMNALTPLINRYSKQKVFGTSVGSSGAGKA